MKAAKIADGIYCVHADIHTNDLFEGIWPVPNGVSLNSYFVQGEKSALIDLVRDWDSAPNQILDCLSSIAGNINFASIDYLILNHLEPDHTGWLLDFCKINSKAQIISTQKGIDLVTKFCKMKDAGRLRAVKDGDSLDLGGGKVISFYEAANVHWPETMVSFENSSGTLFSCDAFGSYGSLDGKVFDDEFSSEEHKVFEKETLRYYANIISSFSVFVEKAIAKISALQIKCIAPSHGIVWRKNVQTIIDRYIKYASYAKGKCEKEITVVWGSMYGCTKAGVDAVVRGIEAEGIHYSLHQIPNEDVSYILASAWKSAAIVIAMPTYEYAMFPPAAYVIDMLKRKHVFNKTILRLGSFGWIGGAKKEYEAAIESLKCKHIESYEWSGVPAAEDLSVLEKRGRELAIAVKNSN
jgi:flavorubredoxin